MTKQDFAAEHEREEKAENIVRLYREYRDATLWGALHGQFSFHQDYLAYAALVRGDAVELSVLTDERTGAVEQWFGEIGFHTDKTDPRRKQARDAMDAAYALMRKEVAQ